MATEIILPKFGNTVEECIIRQWNKNIGDTVAQDEILCEVETDKTTMDIPSLASGVLKHIFYYAGDVVKVMEVIAIIGDKDEDISTLLTHKNENVQMLSEVQKEEKNKKVQDEENVLKQDEITHASSIRTKDDMLTCSPRAKLYLERKNLTEAQFIRHFPIRNFIQNDKSLIEEKDVVNFFSSISSISLHVIQRLINQDKLLVITSGSGIGGRILAKDIDSMKAEKVDFHDEMIMQEHKRTTLSGVRKTIATRMAQSLTETAQVTLTMQASAHNILEARKKYKEQNISISINDIVLYIVAHVLKNFLWANSYLVENTIIEYKNVNLGCAVQTDKGLMVPVIRNASEKNIHDISAEIKMLAEKCKKGTIDVGALQGGTFTITNLGSLGVQFFTPVLNTPQTGILGIGNIELKPVQVDLDFCFRPHLNLSLTFDHKAYDGLDAALLLQAFSNAIACFDGKEALGDAHVFLEGGTNE